MMQPWQSGEAREGASQSGELRKRGVGWWWSCSKSIARHTPQNRCRWLLGSEPVPDGVTQDMPTEKLLPRRNWCLVEERPLDPPSQAGADQPSTPSSPVGQPHQAQ